MGSNPSCGTLRLRGATGRRSGLKPHVLRVRIPPQVCCTLNYRRVAQTVRAAGLYPEARRFDSYSAYHVNCSSMRPNAQCDEHPQMVKLFRHCGQLNADSFLCSRPQWQGRWSPKPVDAGSNPAGHVWKAPLNGRRLVLKTREARKGLGFDSSAFLCALVGTKRNSVINHLTETQNRSSCRKAATRCRTKLALHCTLAAVAEWPGVGLQILLRGFDSHRQLFIAPSSNGKTTDFGSV